MMMSSVIELSAVRMKVYICSKKSSPRPSSISPEIAAVSYMVTKTLVFSDLVPEMAYASTICGVLEKQL